MRQQNSVEEIIRHAQQIRRNTIISLHSAGSGHPGGALSMVEIIAVHRLTMPHWQNGDILKRVL